LAARWAVGAARADAEHRIFEPLTQHVSDETKQAIDGLLGIDPEGDLSGVSSDPGDATDFYRFAAYPPEAKAKHILTCLHGKRSIARSGHAYSGASPHCGNWPRPSSPWRPPRNLL
jgi:hypothetical protein